MTIVTLAIIAVGFLLFGLISGRLERSVVTPPMVFVALGIAIGPAGLGLQEFDIELGMLHTLAELTLILVLFGDAARIDLRLLVRDHNLPVRMLVIGMPMIILLGAVVGLVIFPEFSIWQAALLAAILAPTDAALGQAVVASSNVPVRIRQSVNVESGLNDGIALPFVLIFVSLIGAHEGDTTNWWAFSASQIGGGLLIGAATGYFGGKLIEICTERGWMTLSFQRLSVLALALATFALAELLGGNGFIAAFIGGIVMGNLSRSICPRLHEFSEVEGKLLTLLTFLFFGASMAIAAFLYLDARVLIYAMLSLTIVRVIPIVMSLTGTGLRLGSKLFLAWFGPRGLASILFVVLVVEHNDLENGNLFLSVVATTVLLSVFAHGVTAFPISQLYARVCAALGPEIAEHVDVAEMPLRKSHKIDIEEK